MRLLLLHVLMIICQQVSAQNRHLFPVAVGNKFGYIDSSGQIIIPPRFYSARKFSEGLAAVRENGRYGYLNVSGSYVIPPQYDFALEFEGGIARVFVDGERLFINPNGRQVLPRSIRQLTMLGNHTAMVTTSSGKCGIVDLHTFTFIVDTIYGHIGPFSCGVATVETYRRKLDKISPTKAVLDSSGRIIVPFGRYDDIGEFSEGLAWIRKGRYPGHTYGIIDARGHERFMKKRPLIYSPGEPFYDGRAVFGNYAPWYYGEDEMKFAHDSTVHGYIDCNGHIRYSEPGIQYQDHFSEARVFLNKGEERHYLYDTAFRRIGTATYLEVFNHGFHNGLAIVKDTAYWGIIDTSGKCVVPFRYEFIMGVAGNYFFHCCTTAGGKKLYGASTLAGDDVIPDTLDQYDPEGFVDGLLHGRMDGREVYLNQKGFVVWQEDTSKPQLQPLNIDYMKWVTYVARAVPLPGSFAVLSGQMHLYIDTLKTDTFGHSALGWQLFLMNHTKDTITLEADLCRLAIRLQALDSKGNWRDIEYIQPSQCSYAFHALRLPAHSCMKFIVPMYDGEVQTLIRAKLNLNGRYIKQRTKPHVLYSAPIRGRVNPGQFWNNRVFRDVHFGEGFYE